MSLATATLLTSFNPATGEPVGEVPVTPVREIPAAVDRARAALEGWAGRSLDERIETLLPAGSALAERAEELGRLLTQEMGKPLPEGVGEVRHCGAGIERKVREIAEALAPEVLENDKVRSVVHHDPFGVCAAISPWNFPLAMPHSLVIPSLMAGNTVILKPSEETPLIAQAYVDVLNKTLPADVLQIVHGDEVQGRALVDADVDLIAFTGSREAGKNILEAASGGLKRVILELGGKDPMIVLSDADVETAAQFAVRNSFRNAGQVCVSTERIYVDDAVAERFENEVVRLTGEINVGDGLEEGVEVGPMINARQRNHVLKQIDAAVADGARVAAGGAGHRDNFIMPTVLTGVTHAMNIMQDETFGPVACIERFHDVDEAVQLANDTPFGLGACVFGGDEKATAAVARRLRAGMVGINQGCYGAPGTPWVGAQQSGYGYHGGRDGHRQFTQTRVVSTPKSQ